MVSWRRTSTRRLPRSFIDTLLFKTAQAALGTLVMKKNKNRIVVFLVGAILCLVVLEVSLRVVGAVYSHFSESESGAGKSAGNTILCLGDSVTFGLGAARGFSYPAQLQNMLDESHPEKKYNVINRGWPGQNSAQLLLRVEKYLQEFKPEIVTLLTGARNQDNYYGFREYLEQSGEGQRGLFLSLHDRLDAIRLYKFIRLLIRDVTAAGSRLHIVEELPEIQPGKYPSEVRRGWDEDHPSTQEAVEDCFIAERHKEMGQYDRALRFIESVVNTKDVTGSCYYLAGTIYREKKEYDRSIGWFKRGIAHDPTFFGNYDGIGLSLSEQDRLQEAIQWFEKGFAEARYESLYGHCYIGIARAFRKSGDTQSAIRFFEREVKRSSPVDNYLNRLAADYLLLFEKQSSARDVAGWIRSDINKLLALLQRYGVKVILQNYPHEPAIAHIYREVGENSGLVFVDHHRTFSRYTKDSVLHPDYFVPDGHPNDQGYQLMAKNLWTVITSTRKQN